MIAFIEQLDINYQNGLAPWRTLPLRPCVSSKLYYPSSTEYSPEKLCSYDKQIDYTTVGGAINKIGCISTIKTSELVLYCLRFALSLQNNPETDISI